MASLGLTSGYLMALLAGSAEFGGPCRCSVYCGLAAAARPRDGRGHLPRHFRGLVPGE
jgi:hypothetical protein